MHAISSYHGNRPTHPQTGPITIRCAAASALCNNINCWYCYCYYFTFCSTRLFFKRSLQVRPGPPPKIFQIINFRDCWWKIFSAGRMPFLSPSPRCQITEVISQYCVTTKRSCYQFGRFLEEVVRKHSSHDVRPTGQQSSVRSDRSVVHLKINVCHAQFQPIPPLHHLISLSVLTAIFQVDLG